MEKIVLDTNCLVQSISPRSAYRKVWDSFLTTAGARYIVTEDHHYDVIKWKDFPGIDVIGLDDFLLHLNAMTPK